MPGHRHGPHHPAPEHSQTLLHSGSPPAPEEAVQDAWEAGLSQMMAAELQLRV